MVMRRGSPLWRLYSLCFVTPAWRLRSFGAHMWCACQGIQQWSAAVVAGHLVFTSAQGDSFRFIPGTVVQHLQTDDEVHAVLAAAKTVVP